MNDCPRRYSWKESGLSVSFNHSETPRKMKVLRGVLLLKRLFQRFEHTDIAAVGTGVAEATVQMFETECFGLLYRQRWIVQAYAFEMIDFVIAEAFTDNVGDSQVIVRAYWPDPDRKISLAEK
jgi:hypothetical protein